MNNRTSYCRLGSIYWLRPLFYALSIGTLHCCLAQSSTQSSRQYVRDFVGDGRQIRSFDNRYEGVRGSPYLFEEWASFRIAKGGTEYVMDSRLEAYGPSIVYKINNLEFEKSLENIDSACLVFEEIEIPVVLLGTGKIGLLFEKEETVYRLEILKQLKKADYEGAYSQKRNYDEFVTKIQLQSRSNLASFEKVRKRAYQELGVSKSELTQVMKAGDLVAFHRLIMQITTE